MVSKIQKIKEEIANLENKTSLLYGEIYEAYSKYFQALSQSVNKQLVLATYQICTQSYPEAFLKLSYKQRQKIQENIKSIAKTVPNELEGYLQKSHELESSPLEALDLMEKMLLNLSNSDPETIINKTEDGYEIFPAKVNSNSSMPINEEPNTDQAEEDNPESEIWSLESPEENEQIINNPDHLGSWCKMIEQGIVTTLDNLSKETNHILQKAHILPSQLPPQVLDMAIQAEEVGQAISGSPNLLNVIVETGQKNLDENLEEPEITSKITKITAIHLRLTEIEFADAALSIQHKEIRNLLEKVGQLRKQYHKKQREGAVVEAEAAWRACWYEE